MSDSLAHFKSGMTSFRAAHAALKLGYELRYSIGKLDNDELGRPLSPKRELSSKVGVLSP